ncbi:PTS sugar transporter subunit IIB [Salipaludibacillus agaradhaerens]|jgi:PTS system galactitol-specific IIB component|uniref:PTS sugar transporter subunit IIB n=1 Tax=Salipaludibacillus agaradhaerens TaxID=76935 RepID=A0A9Q4AZF5_SALAG|nr:PTS sugar transporter subunit IIB [Salipaludibacillus agaradhaerens]MCR6111538.1 PTS sugar transporter subunit IIB [Bacillus sp. A301a_S52]UJW58539.1 PTS sugar transporter subunit IIB [Bacillus sp. A116_S68]MCR6095623.1 PTS sugar transporter subunit IIB [Salipaludibacillus agaradhaerens]MCR6107487.1 PTS sugar transporter subunit IIB [Salipaludibacillus agaradhaerens]MCR6114817.1 PTS sugar transporter subunit IIB [Salipaludibacillus agaradhaerens]
MKKHILVACGTGIATSTVVNGELEKICKEHELDVNLIQCKVSEISSYADQADLLITTTIIKKEYPFPVINARAFLTGIGLDEVKQDILQELKK